MVHAYDLNMQIPDTPQDPAEDENLDPLSSTAVFDTRPRLLIEGSNIPVNPYKRRRSSPAEWSYGPAAKYRAVPQSSSRHMSPRSADLKSAVQDCKRIMSSSPHGRLASAREVNPEDTGHAAVKGDRRPSVRQGNESETNSSAGLRQTNLHELLRLVINESLRVGGRPESAIAEDTQRGERIEVRTRTSSGKITSKIIEWSIDPLVPDNVFIDERDLAKLLSCVFLNAVKFTENGEIFLDVSLSVSSRYIVITVRDTGTGIPEAFLPNLFKPFSREDDSLTRQSEGLGLGLLVAKGLARKLGGDLKCIRSDTSGPRRGSEFEIKVPVTPDDISSRPQSPLTTPTPSRAPSTGPLSETPGVTNALRYPQTSPSRPSPLNQRKDANDTERTSTGPTTRSRLSSPSQIRNPFPEKQPSSSSKKSSSLNFDRDLAKKHPLNFLVAEDNRINRKLLVNMLSKLGYTDVAEAYDGTEAVRIMEERLALLPTNSSQTPSAQKSPFDVILMDLWMPHLDGYEATETILKLVEESNARSGVKHELTVLAVSADVTDEAIARATEVGMEGFMTKPYKLMDLQRLIVEFSGRRNHVTAAAAATAADAVEREKERETEA